MTTTKMTSDLRFDRYRPIGARVRRVAQVRRATVSGIVAAREKATAALVVAAKRKAIPEHMPTGVHTVRTWGDRVREWALDTAARLVARKIERDTDKARLFGLEALKVGGKDFEFGMWFFVNVMKGNVAA